MLSVTGRPHLTTLLSQCPQHLTQLARPQLTIAQRQQRRGIFTEVCFIVVGFMSYSAPQARGHLQEPIDEAYASEDKCFRLSGVAPVAAGAVLRSHTSAAGRVCVERFWSVSTVTVLSVNMVASSNDMDLMFEAQRTSYRNKALNKQITNNSSHEKRKHRSCWHEHCFLDWAAHRHTLMIGFFRRSYTQRRTCGFEADIP